MKNNEPIITIAQYSMSTARGMMLDSTSYDSLEHALSLSKLCADTHSIVIETNVQVIGPVVNSEFDNLLEQLRKKLRELFPNEH